MFDVGFSELVLLFMIGLLVLGPQRLPKVAAEIGKWVGRARRTATQLRRQLEREIELADIEPTRPSASSESSEPAKPAESSESPTAAATDTVAANQSETPEPSPDASPEAADATPPTEQPAEKTPQT